MVPNYTPEDLQKLPLRAIVALSARCARQVQHLALVPHDHPEYERCRAAVRAALRMAEDFAGACLARPSSRSSARSRRAGRLGRGRWCTTSRWPRSSHGPRGDDRGARLGPARRARGSTLVRSRPRPIPFPTWRTSRPTGPRGTPSRRPWSGQRRRVHRPVPQGGRRGLREAPAASTSGATRRQGSRSTPRPTGRSSRRSPCDDAEPPPDRGLVSSGDPRESRHLGHSGRRSRERPSVRPGFWRVRRPGRDARVGGRSGRLVESRYENHIINRDCAQGRRRHPVAPPGRGPGGPTCGARVGGAIPSRTDGPVATCIPTCVEDAGRLRARAVGQPVVLAPDGSSSSRPIPRSIRGFQFWTFGYSTGNPILFL